MANRFNADQPLANTHFIVQLTGLDVDNYELECNRVDGINDGTTSVMWHRESGTDSTSLMPYVSITKLDPITLEGPIYNTMSDVEYLTQWRNQVKGEGADFSFGGEYRDLVLIPMIYNEFGEEVPATGSSAGWKSFRFENCVCTKLQISSFDANSPDILKYTIEIVAQSMKLQDRSL